MTSFQKSFVLLKNSLTYYCYYIFLKYFIKISTLDVKIEDKTDDVKPVLNGDIINATKPDDDANVKRSGRRKRGAAITDVKKEAECDDVKPGRLFYTCIEVKCILIKHKFLILQI